MPDERVLATQQARDAVRKLRTIIGGDLTTKIGDVIRQGDILADPTNWDGRLASQFREPVWRDTKQALNKALQELGDLSQQVDKITGQIMQAGT